MKEVLEFLKAGEWTIRHQVSAPEREGEFLDPAALSLSGPSRRVLAPFTRGIYRHQFEAIRGAISGANIGITTSTSSGKSLAFHIPALEVLESAAEATVLAIYPLKALATEQYDRWRTVVTAAKVGVEVGRIDGSVHTTERKAVVQRARVIVMTPDVVHAWLLRSTTEPFVRRFLKNLGLVIVDEAHTYSGVFGSNSAFLFRRLQHVVARLGGDVRFIASSATIRDPQTHLRSLIGIPFDVIGADVDTSPKQSVETLLLDPPPDQDLLVNLSELMHFVVKNTSMHFITFVDSRKQTEYLAAITDRKGRRPDEDEEAAFSEFPKLDIHPYRAGYEETDRNAIQRQLTEGTLRGVISTSALEMGIDIPSLNLAILSGVPSSATSFMQRVGRIGRHQPGLVFLVNDGSVVSETIFANPHLIENMPLNESALYLENRYVQYIHALCLARHGGEDDIVTGGSGEETGFSSPVEFPEDFHELCRSERVGEIPADLQSMKGRAGDNPNHVFPLRDIEPQYKVENRQVPDSRLGSLSFSQLLREAYPGAVYYYQARPYRVYRIREREKTVEVRREKNYFTSPSNLPPMIFPNLTEGNVYGALKCDALTLIEANVQVRESIVGYKERRGPNELVVTYPLNPIFNMFFDQPRLTRNFFTSGVLLQHPSLDRKGVEVEQLEQILFEAFLMVVPFERRDVSSGSGRFKVSRDFVQEGTRFICIYDETYGSLRLTSRLLRDAIITAVFERALEVAQTHGFRALTAQSLTALEDLAEAAVGPFTDLLFTSPERVALSGELVIMPGSVGLDPRRDNEEFYVDGVFYNPQVGSLVYRGKHLSDMKRAQGQAGKHGPVVITIPIGSVVPIPGESQLGTYNYETGDVSALEQ